MLPARKSVASGGKEQVRFQNLIPAAQAAGLDVNHSMFYRLVVSLTPISP